MPLYDPGQTCFLAGANGPQLTDNLAKQAAADATQNVTYPGVFRLHTGEVADGCHANTAGQQSLGRQAVARDTSYKRCLPRHACVVLRCCANEPAGLGSLAPSAVTIGTVMPDPHAAPWHRLLVKGR